MREPVTDGSMPLAAVANQLQTKGDSVNDSGSVISQGLTSEQARARFACRPNDRHRARLARLAHESPAAAALGKSIGQRDRLHLPPQPAEDSGV